MTGYYLHVWLSCCWRPSLHVAQTVGCGDRVCGWFHADHINLRNWMVDVTIRESVEILCCWLAKIGGSASRWVRKGLGGTWFNILGGTANKFISWILLRRWTQLGTYVVKIRRHLRELPHGYVDVTSLFSQVLPHCLVRMDHDYGLEGCPVTRNRPRYSG